MQLFEGRTADELWRRAAVRIDSRDGTSLQSRRVGKTLELLHACFVLHDPHERWVVNRRPAMNPAFALAEVVWILSGRDDSGFLNFWNPVLRKYAGDGPTYYGAYGHRLRYRFGVDQIRAAFEALRSRPDSRQVVLQIWDARADLPVDAGTPREADIPCNLCAMLKVREGRLEWVQVMRSNDLILGLPHNLVQFTTLQEMMAAWVGCEAGTYTHFSDSLHVYEREAVGFYEPVPLVAEANVDRWNGGYSETMAVIGDVGRRMDVMREYGVDRESVRQAALTAQMPCAAQNLLAIVGADAARRHGFVELADELSMRCTNPALRQLWARWLDRQEDRHVKEREAEQH